MRYKCSKCADTGVIEDVERSIFGHTVWFCNCKLGTQKHNEEKRWEELNKGKPLDY